jgi:predicted permease
MRLAPSVRPLKNDVVGKAGDTLWVLMGTVGIVLLIACANVANLVLARTEGRQHELSIRAALGAGSWRIARVLLTESAVLSIAGGILGVGLAYAGLAVLLAIAPSNLPRAGEISIDSTALLFALAASLASGLLVGVIPAVRYARRGPATALRSGGRSMSAGPERLRARAVLVVSQVALALVLLICAGLMIRTFFELNRVNPGFGSGAEVLTANVTIRQATAPDPEAAVRKQQAILERLSALPGVTSAAYTSAVPMGGGFTADMFIPEGKTFDEGNPPRARQLRFISPGLFETLHIPLVVGRDFTWTDIYHRRPVALVSENLARLEWGGPEQALGKRVKGSAQQDQWFEIVGVVGNVQDRGLSQETVGILYIPILAERVYGAAVQAWRSVTYTVRSARTGDPSFMEEIRRAVWAVDSTLPLTNVRTMGDILDASLAATSFTIVMLVIAGAIAFLLVLIGIYGVISYGVSQRVREIGIRIALGAERGSVQRTFLLQGLAMASIGVVIGLAAAATLTHWMSSLLFEVSPVDPLTYVGVSTALLVAAGLASYLPSRRAARVDPIVSLRSE